VQRAARGNRFAADNARGAPESRVKVDYVVYMYVRSGGDDADFASTSLTRETIALFSITLSDVLPNADLSLRKLLLDAL
jgi:hypothetical protein